MELQIRTHNVRLTDSLEDYIRNSAAKLNRLNIRIVDAKLELSAEKPRSGGEQFKVQFTISTPGHLLRSEVKNHDQHVAIDSAVDKMRRQIRRYHDRQIDRSKSNAVNLGQLAADQQLLEDGDAANIQSSDTPLIMRTKRFDLKPMDAEEAVEQMELLGHDFFVFTNPNTGHTNVIYRREAGTYGLIEPDS